MYAPVVAQPGHKDRLSAVDASFLAQEKQSSHMHVGAVVIFDGPPPGRDEFLAHLELAARAGAALPAEARLPAARGGAPVLGRRPQLQPRLPRAPHRAAEAGHARTSCASWPAGSTRSGWTARSRCGRTGSSRGSRTAASRSSRRLTTRWWTACPAWTSRRSCSTSRPCRTRWSRRRPGRRRPSRPTWSSWPRASSASPRRRSASPGRALGALQRPGETLEQVREAVEGLGEVVWAGMNPAPTCR